MAINSRHSIFEYTAFKVFLIPRCFVIGNRGGQQLFSSIAYLSQLLLFLLYENNSIILGGQYRKLSKVASNIMPMPIFSFFPFLRPAGILATNLLLSLSPLPSLSLLAPVPFWCPILGRLSHFGVGWGGAPVPFWRLKKGVSQEVRHLQKDKGQANLLQNSFRFRQN